MSLTPSSIAGPAGAHADLTPPDAPADDAALDSSHRPRLAPFVLEYWKSDDKWKALALLAITLGITFFTTFLTVKANQLLGEVTDALVERQWRALLIAFTASVGIGVVSGLVTISNVAVGQVLDLRWRSWLTERLLARWTRASEFYDIERDGLLKNADQRIAEDVRLFTDSFLNSKRSIDPALEPRALS